MKRKILLGLLAVVMCFTLVGCGNDGNIDKESSKTSGGSSGKNSSEVVVSDASSVDDYTDGAIKIMKSLGKSVKDEQLVTVTGNYYQTVYTIFFYSDGVLSNKTEYTFLTKDQEDMYRSLTEYVDDTMEVNSSDMWIKRDYGDTGDSTYEDDYEVYSSISMQKIVE